MGGASGTFPAQQGRCDIISVKTQFPIPLLYYLWYYVVLIKIHAILYLKLILEKCDLFHVYFVILMYL